MTSLFTKIAKGEIDADIVFENSHVIAIKDINPVAPVHLLIIPKKEIPNLQSVDEDDLSLMGEIVAVAQALAKEFELEEGYRFITNNGPDSGQEIEHLHFHLIGGRRLGQLG